MIIRAWIDENGTLRCASQVCGEDCPRWDGCRYYDISLVDAEQEALNETSVLKALLLKEIIYKEALKRFGIQTQLLKCIEELAELQQTLAWWLGTKHKGAAVERIAEEMADVEIMLEQLKQAFPTIRKAVKQYKADKLVRLDRLIEEADGVNVGT